MALRNSKSAGSRHVAWTLAWFLGISGLAQMASAQVAGDVEVLQVRPNFHMIAGAGANIGVQFGDDGVVLTDSGSGQMTDRVPAEIRELSDKTIRFVVNTSADADHERRIRFAIIEACRKRLPQACASP